MIRSILMSMEVQVKKKSLKLKNGMLLLYGLGTFKLTIVQFVEITSWIHVQTVNRVEIQMKNAQ